MTLIHLTGIKTLGLLQLNTVFPIRKIILDTQLIKCQTWALDIYITLSQWIFLHVSFRKALSSGSPTKEIQHHTKSVNFVHSWGGLKGSNDLDVDISLYRIHINHNTPRQICTKVTKMVICCISLFWFPEDVPLWTETCRNVQCDIVILISKSWVCVFVSLMSWITNR